MSFVALLPSIVSTKVYQVNRDVRNDSQKSNSSRRPKGGFWTGNLNDACFHFLPCVEGMYQRKKAAS